MKETWKSVLRQAADCVAAQRWSLHCASINSSVQSTGRKVELSEKSTKIGQDPRNTHGGAGNKLLWMLLSGTGCDNCRRPGPRE